MPLFSAVVDQEKPKSERDDYAEEMKKHREFDAGVNPHMASEKEFYGGKSYDHGAQRISKSHRMIQNEKGLWVKAPKERLEKAERQDISKTKRKLRRNEFGEYVPIPEKDNEMGKKNPSLQRPQRWRQDKIGHYRSRSPRRKEKTSPRNYSAEREEARSSNLKSFERNFQPTQRGRKTPERERHLSRPRYEYRYKRKP